MTRRGILGLLVVGAGLLVSGCGLFGAKSTYRFKMTVEVQTSQGLRTGYAVREISYSKNLIKLPDMAAEIGRAHV